MKSYAAFISHTSSESKLAICLKEWIESTFAGHTAVFVSSDTRDLRAGDKWFHEIDEALNTVKVQLVVCSPYSLTRPWIHFESGCAWIRHIPIVPVCHSGITKDTLPSPLSTFQGLTLEKGFSEQLMTALAHHFQIAKLPRISFAEMDEELLKAVAAIAKPSSTPSAALASTDTLADLDEVQTSILGILSTVDGHNMPAEQLAEHLEIPVSKLKYIADRLVKADYIYRPLIMGGGTLYTLADKGRAHLVEKGLLD